MYNPCADQFPSLPWFSLNLVNTGTALTRIVTTGRYACSCELCNIRATTPTWPEPVFGQDVYVSYQCTLLGLTADQENDFSVLALTNFSLFTDFGGTWSVQGLRLPVASQWAAMRAQVSFVISTPTWTWSYLVVPAYQTWGQGSKPRSNNSKEKKYFFGVDFWQQLWE